MKYLQMKLAFGKWLIYIALPQETVYFNQGEHQFSILLQRGINPNVISSTEVSFVGGRKRKKKVQFARYKTPVEQDSIAAGTDPNATTSSHVLPDATSCKVPDDDPTEDTRSKKTIQS